MKQGRLPGHRWLHQAARRLGLATLIILGTVAHAGEARVIPVSGEHQHVALDDALRVFESPADDLDLESVLDAPDALAWRRPAGRHFHPGLTRARWWLRVDLHNLDDEPQARVIVIAQPTLDEVRFALLCDDGYTEAALNGDSLPWSARRLPDRNPAFDFMLPAQARCTALFTVKSLETVAFPATLADPVTYFTLQQTDNLLRGGLLGMQLLFMLLAVVALGVAGRLAGAGLFVLLMASQAWLILIFTGLGFQFLWGDMPLLQRALTGSAVAICWACTAEFALRLLPPEMLEGRLPRILRLTWIIMLLLSAAHILAPDNRLLTAIIALVTLGLLLLLFMVIAAISLGNPRFGLVATALCVLLAGAITEATAFLGVFPFSFRFLVPLQVAFLLHDALVGAALLRPAAANSPGQPAPRRRATEHEVNRRVAERTRELASTVAQLKSVNRQLDMLSLTDALTGTWNRRYMDQALVRLAADRDDPLSLVLFDIDFFKDVNDRHGHPVGDRCLREVALCVRRQLRDENDLLCRYGGEEFAVILPDTTLEGAQVVAEKIRRAVEQVEIRCSPDIRLRLTISLGIAGLAGDRDVEHLVGSADQALYHAKRAGRNRWLAATA